MQIYLKIALVIALTALGGLLGGLAGFAMDRFPGLGLDPERFWHTDPENVWAWGIILGGALGFCLGISIILLQAFRRHAESGIQTPTPLNSLESPG